MHRCRVFLKKFVQDCAYAELSLFFCKFFMCLGKDVILFVLGNVSPGVNNRTILGYISHLPFKAYCCRVIAVICNF